MKSRAWVTCCWKNQLIACLKCMKSCLHSGHTNPCTQPVSNLWWTLQSALCHLWMLVQMLTFFSCFCLFWHPALRLLWASLHSICVLLLNEAYSHYPQECAYVQPHLFVYATFAACLLDDGFRVCRWPASVNCWEVLTVATGYSPELGYKLEIMASTYYF